MAREANAPGEIASALTRTSAILRGHFVLSSGKHSSVYFQCARFLARPEEADRAGAALGALFENVDCVIAPAIGGIVLSYVVARAMNVPSYFAERADDGSFALRRGFQLRAGENVLVVEDVLTTGGSALKVARLVENLGAKVAGIGALVNRGNVVLGGYTVKALMNLDAPLYDPATCPLCKEGTPVEKPGSNPRV